jgi:hypothetical protein
MAELPTPTRVLDLALAHLEQSDPIRQFVFANYCKQYSFIQNYKILLS